MKLSLHLSFQLSHTLGGYTVGYHRRILSYDHGGFSPKALTPNPATVSIVTYEYLFCLLSSE
jgi:hypothetical protein